MNNNQLSLFAPISADTLETIGLNQARESILPEYLPQFSREEQINQGLGIALAHYTQWDGVRIMEIAALALEDANFHSEAEYLFNLVKQYNEPLPDPDNDYWFWLDDNVYPADTVIYEPIKREIYTYCMLNRPAGYGTCPEGRLIDRDAYHKPTEEQNDYGTVCYDRKLNQEEMYKWDMCPASDNAYLYPVGVRVLVNDIDEATVTAHMPRGFYQVTYDCNGATQTVHIKQIEWWYDQPKPIVYLLPATIPTEEPPNNCAVCGREVHMNPVHEFGYIYHVDCWRKRVQREQEIRDNATKPYTCAICEQPVTVNIRHQNGRQFHEECYYRMEAYGQRVEARYNRLLNAATKHEQESDRLHAYTSKVYDGLNGTPILIGHHSEKRHRRLLDKLWSMDGKAYQHYKTAERLRERAEATRKNRAISSDDPAAVLKLKEKLANLEAAHEHMVKVNKVIHKLAKRPKLEDAGTLYLGSPERREIWQRNEAKMAEFVKGLPALATKLAEMAGISEAEARKLLTPDDLHRFGYISYELTNSTAEIRRLKQRIEDLQKQAKQAATAPESERTYGDIRVIENAAENRLQIVFPGKPAKDVIAALKSHGFKWSPSNMAWQRMLTADARWKVEYVLKIAGVSIPTE